MTLPDAIVLDAILGAAKAAGVHVKFGGWQGTDATADCTKALVLIVAKTVKDVGRVSRFEGCDIKEYLETGLHDRREGPKRLSRAKPRGTFDLPNRINAGTLTQRAVFFCPMDRCNNCRTADAADHFLELDCGEDETGWGAWDAEPPPSRFSFDDGMFEDVMALQDVDGYFSADAMEGLR